MTHGGYFKKDFYQILHPHSSDSSDSLDSLDSLDLLTTVIKENIDIFDLLKYFKNLVKTPFRLIDEFGYIIQEIKPSLPEEKFPVYQLKYSNPYFSIVELVEYSDIEIKEDVKHKPFINTDFKKIKIGDYNFVFFESIFMFSYENIFFKNFIDSFLEKNNRHLIYIFLSKLYSFSDISDTSIVFREALIRSPLMKLLLTGLNFRTVLEKAFFKNIKSFSLDTPELPIKFDSPIDITRIIGDKNNDGLFPEKHYFRKSPISNIAWIVQYIHKKLQSETKYSSLYETNCDMDLYNLFCNFFEEKLLEHVAPYIYVYKRKKHTFSEQVLTKLRHSKFPDDKNFIIMIDSLLKLGIDINKIIKALNVDILYSPNPTEFFEMQFINDNFPNVKDQYFKEQYKKTIEEFTKNIKAIIPEATLKEEDTLEEFIKDIEQKLTTTPMAAGAAEDAKTSGVIDKVALQKKTQNNKTVTKITGLIKNLKRVYDSGRNLITNKTKYKYQSHTQINQYIYNYQTYVKYYLFTYDNLFDCYHLISNVNNIFELHYSVEKAKKNESKRSEILNPRISSTYEDNYIELISELALIKMCMDSLDNAFIHYDFGSTFIFHYYYSILFNDKSVLPINNKEIFDSIFKTNTTFYNISGIDKDLTIDKLLYSRYIQNQTFLQVDEIPALETTWTKQDCDQIESNVKIIYTDCGERTTLILLMTFLWNGTTLDINKLPKKTSSKIKSFFEKYQNDLSVNLAFKEKKEEISLNWRKVMSTCCDKDYKFIKRTPNSIDKIRYITKKENVLCEIAPAIDNIVNFLLIYVCGEPIDSIIAEEVNTGSSRTFYEKAETNFKKIIDTFKKSGELFFTYFFMPSNLLADSYSSASIELESKDSLTSYLFDFTDIHAYVNLLSNNNIFDNYDEDKDVKLKSFDNNSDYFFALYLISNKMYDYSRIKHSNQYFLYFLYNNNDDDFTDFTKRTNYLIEEDINEFTTHIYDTNLYITLLQDNYAISDQIIKSKLKLRLHDDQRFSNYKALIELKTTIQNENITTNLTFIDTPDEMIFFNKHDFIDEFTQELDLQQYYKNISTDYIINNWFNKTKQRSDFLKNVYFQLNSLLQIYYKKNQTEIKYLKLIYKGGNIVKIILDYFKGKPLTESYTKYLENITSDKISDFDFTIILQCYNNEAHFDSHSLNIRKIVTLFLSIFKDYLDIIDLDLDELLESIYDKKTNKIINIDSFRNNDTTIKNVIFDLNTKTNYIINIDSTNKFLIGYSFFSLFKTRTIGALNLWKINNHDSSIYIYVVSNIVINFAKKPGMQMYSKFDIIRMKLDLQLEVINKSKMFPYVSEFIIEDKIDKSMYLTDSYKIDLKKIKDVSIFDNDKRKISILHIEFTYYDFLDKDMYYFPEMDENYKDSIRKIITYSLDEIKVMKNMTLLIYKSIRKEIVVEDQSLRKEIVVEDKSLIDISDEVYKEVFIINNKGFLYRVDEQNKDIYINDDYMKIENKTVTIPAEERKYFDDVIKNYNYEEAENCIIIDNDKKEKFSAPSELIDVTIPHYTSSDYMSFTNQIKKNTTNIRENNDSIKCYSLSYLIEDLIVTLFVHKFDPFYDQKINKRLNRLFSLYSIYQNSEQDSLEKNRNFTKILNDIKTSLDISIDIKSCIDNFFINSDIDLEVDNINYIITEETLVLPENFNIIIKSIKLKFIFCQLSKWRQNKELPEYKEHIPIYEKLETLLVIICDAYNARVPNPTRYINNFRKLLDELISNMEKINKLETDKNIAEILEDIEPSSLLTRGSSTGSTLQTTFGGKIKIKYSL